MHSSCYETLTFRFRRLRSWQVSRTKATLPDTSGLVTGVSPSLARHRLRTVPDIFPHRLAQVGS